MDAQSGRGIESKVGDDFALYSELVEFPEGATEEEVERWFANIYSGWHQIPGIFTSSGLKKALDELSRRGWSFTLTLSQSERLSGVADAERKPFMGSTISWFDITTQGMGFATKESPYFVSLSQDLLTFSQINRGLIKAFEPRDIVSLIAMAPSCPMGKPRE